MLFSNLFFFSGGTEFESDQHLTQDVPSGGSHGEDKQQVH